MKYTARIALICSFSLVACCIKVGPDYIRPEMVLPEDWQTASQKYPEAGATDVQQLSRWWTIFDDPTLSALIERAIAGNLDLQRAKARLWEARSQKLATQADLFPAINGTGSATRNKSRLHSSETGTVKEYDTRSSGTIDASWEIDIFGGIRRSVEAAEADFQAAREDLRDVLVSLIAEVALNYLSLRTTQSRIEITDNNLRTQNDTYQLVSWQYQAGLSDDLSVQQAKYNLESTRSKLPTLYTAHIQYLNRIAVLLGEHPGQVAEEVSRKEPIPVTPTEVAVEVPADVLRQRPDIRRAERELAAQSARIGVAVAELYPHLSLNGSIGIETLAIHGQPYVKTSSMVFGPQISWAIFKAGAIRQNIEIQKALHEQSLITYESTILIALEDVENSLTAFAEEQFRRQYLQDATRAARSAVDLSQAKYQAGLTDFTDVLIAERSLFSLEDELMQSSGTVAANLVSLYKALGGGWESFAPADNQ